MWRLLILQLLLLPLFSSGQKATELFYDFNQVPTSEDQASFYGLIKKTDSGWFRQIEYIHSNSYYFQGLYQDQDCLIPHGYSRSYYPGGNVKTMGKYVRGKRVGLWMYYFENGKPEDSSFFLNDRLQNSKAWYPNGVLKDSMVLDEDGNGDFISWYDNGQVSSIGRVVKFEMHADQWKYYHKNGKLAANVVFNSRSDKVIDSRYYDESGNEARLERDRKAVFPGRPNAWNSYMEKNVVMPDGFRLEGGNKATVVIHAYINTEGRIIYAYVKVPLHPVFEEAALKAVKDSPAWIPAIHHNRKIYYEIDVPFTFIQKHSSK